MESEARTQRRRLKQAGYTVMWAEDYAQAKALLESGHFHLAIVDISLGPPLGQNKDGLRLLEDLETLNLREIMPTVVITGYSKKAEWVREAWSKHATDFVAKKPGYVSELAEKVNRIFQEHVSINFNLNYLGDVDSLIDQVATHIHVSEAESDWPPRDQLVLQVRDLVGKVFVNANSILLKSPQMGLSGSVVLRAHPTFETGVGRWFVLKVGTRKKTRIEEENFNRYVKLYLPVNFATQLSSGYSRHLGALLYTLNTPEVERAPDLAHFYSQQSSVHIITALRHLFFGTCALWYRNRQPPRHANVRDLYLTAFNLTVERIFNEARSFFPEWVDLSRVRIPPCTDDLPNPLRRLQNQDVWQLDVAQCVTHGDLNAGNILINEQGQCWLIDFYRTYPSHILRDVVVLETDLKFRVMPTLEPTEFVKLERMLLNLAPNSQPELEANFSAEARKAVEVLAGLRQIAWELLDCNKGTSAPNAQREYLLSLLMATLNVLRLRHFKEDPRLQPRRKDAFLSAALICQKLDELSGI
ncbi:MAG: response regulator [Anaerolineae bacterium]|nr:response regulator [Anaerolineae bacterium]